MSKIIYYINVDRIRFDDWFTKDPFIGQKIINDLLISQNLNKIEQDSPYRIVQIVRTLLPYDYYYNSQGKQYEFTEQFIAMLSSFGIQHVFAIVNKTNHEVLAIDIPLIYSAAKNFAIQLSTYGAKVNFYQSEASSYTVFVFGQSDETKSQDIVSPEKKEGEEIKTTEEVTVEKKVEIIEENKDENQPITQ